jgi:hypothetical protein
MIAYLIKNHKDSLRKYAAIDSNNSFKSSSDSCNVLSKNDKSNTSLDADHALALQIALNEYEIDNDNDDDIEDNNSTNNLVNVPPNGNNKSNNNTNNTRSKTKQTKSFDYLMSNKSSSSMIHQNKNNNSSTSSKEIVNINNKNLNHKKIKILNAKNLPIINKQNKSVKKYDTDDDDDNEDDDEEEDDDNDKGIYLNNEEDDNKYKEFRLQTLLNKTNDIVLKLNKFMNDNLNDTTDNHQYVNLPLKSTQSTSNTSISNSNSVTGKFSCQAQLRDYQKGGVEWLCGLYKSKLNGILADEMGLGIINYY